MSERPTPAVVMISVIAGALLCAATAGPDERRVNPNAAAIAEFQEQVQAYVDLRNKLEGTVGQLKETANPEEIAARERALGEAIRGARARARRADIFNARACIILRKIVKDDFRSRSPREKALAVQELPPFTPKINQTYPSEFPLATFPPTILAQLPALPAELEYRLVADHLILRDTEANVIIDFVADVLP